MHGPAAFDVLASRLTESEAVARWGRAAFDRYVGQLSHTSIGDVDALARAARIGPECHVVELGCGSGGFACHLARSTGCSIVGFDWSEVAVDLAQKRAAAASLAGRTEFETRDLAALELRPGAADVVVAIDSLQFAPGLATLCGTVAQALRRGGRLAVIATVGVEEGLGIMSRGELTAAYQAAGLVSRDTRCLTPSYASLVARMAQRWRADLDLLRRELGADLAQARLAEDEAILQLLDERRVERVLDVVSHEH